MAAAEVEVVVVAIDVNRHGNGVPLLHATLARDECRRRLPKNHPNNSGHAESLLHRHRHLKRVDETIKDLPCTMDRLLL
jgi:hypothetical protein